MASQYKISERFRLGVSGGTMGWNLWFTVPYSSGAMFKSGLDDKSNHANQEFRNKELKNSTINWLARLGWLPHIPDSQEFPQGVFLLAYIPKKGFLSPSWSVAAVSNGQILTMQATNSCQELGISSLLAFKLKPSHSPPNRSGSSAEKKKALVAQVRMIYSEQLWTSELATRSSHSKWKPLNAECINMINMHRFSLQIRAPAARTCPRSVKSRTCSFSGHVRRQLQNLFLNTFGQLEICSTHLKIDVGKPVAQPKPNSFSAQVPWRMSSQGWMAMMTSPIRNFWKKKLKNSTTGSLEMLPYTALHSQCPAFSVVLLASQTFLKPSLLKVHLQLSLDHQDFELTPPRPKLSHTSTSRRIPQATTGSCCSFSFICSCIRA